MIDIDKYCQIWINIVKHCSILGNIAKYCLILFNIVQVAISALSFLSCYNILRNVNILSNFVKHLLIFSSIAQNCSVLTNIVKCQLWDFFLWPYSFLYVYTKLLSKVTRHCRAGNSGGTSSQKEFGFAESLFLMLRYLQSWTAKSFWNCCKNYLFCIGSISFCGILMIFYSEIQ